MSAVSRLLSPRLSSISNINTPHDVANSTNSATATLVASKSPQFAATSSRKEETKSSIGGYSPPLPSLLTVTTTMSSPTDSAHMPADSAHNSNVQISSKYSANPDIVGVAHSAGTDVYPPSSVPVSAETTASAPSVATSSSHTADAIVAANEKQVSSGLASHTSSARHTALSPMTFSTSTHTNGRAPPYAPFASSPMQLQQLHKQSL